MAAPKVNVKGDSHTEIILFREGAEKTHTFLNYVILIRRTDNDYPVDGETDEDGYIYFIQAFPMNKDEKILYIYLNSDEADVITELMLELTGENLRDY
jgi:hypothetical protein